MVSLSKATYETRLVLKFLAVFIAIVILLTILFRFGEFIKLTYFTSPIPPDQGFGILPRLELGRSEQLPYRINTITGFLPNFADRITVYKTSHPQSTLLTLENAKRKLRSVSFGSNEKKLTDFLYQWSHDLDQGHVITYDTLWDDFDVTSDYKNNDSLLFKNIQGEDARKTVNNFLDALIDDYDMLDFDETRTKHYQLSQGSLIETQQSAAQFVKLTLKYKKIGDLEIYFPNLNDSDMEFIVGLKRDKPEVFEAHFVHRKIDITSFSTYPLKTSQQAYEQLQSGNAKRIPIPDIEPDNDILDMYIAYYIGEKKPEFIMPVFVFKGKSFYAFVDALSSTSTTTSANLN